TRSRLAGFASSCCFAFFGFAFRPMRHPSLWGSLPARPADGIPSLHFKPRPRPTSGAWPCWYYLDFSAAALALDLLMHRAVEDLDDLPFDLDAVGNIDDVGEQPADALGDRALAVARRPVQQDGPAGIDRRSQAIGELLGDHQVGEGLLDSLAVSLL